MSNEDRTQTDLTGSQQAADAKDTLQKILALSGIEVDVVASEDADRIRLNVSPSDSDDIPVIVGVQGRTRNAYQLLVNRMIGQRFDRDECKRISIDVSGVIKEREDHLGTMAQRVAEVARANHLQIEMVGMNPADRRIVHMTLADESDLNTYSTHEGIGRRLVIVG
jgi:spoIIIJ-associated protein